MGACYEPGIRLGNSHGDFIGSLTSWWGALGRAHCSGASFLSPLPLEGGICLISGSSPRLNSMTGRSMAFMSHSPRVFTACCIIGSGEHLHDGSAGWTPARVKDFTRTFWRDHQSAAWMIWYAAAQVSLATHNTLFSISVHLKGMFWHQERAARHMIIVWC